jgi:hypothetical protein
MVQPLGLKNSCSIYDILDAGWFHPKKEKYISLDFSCRTIDFDPTSIPLPVGVSLPLGKRREALKASFSFSLFV